MSTAALSRRAALVKASRVLGTALVPAALLAAWAPHAAEAPALPASPPADPLQAQNAARAAVAFEALRQRYFGTNGMVFETDPPPGQDAFTSLWPYTQTTVAALLLAAIPNLAERYAPLARTLCNGLADYWDAAADPPGYAAARRTADGPGPRKFFDDNAWTGLVLALAYRSWGSRPDLNAAEATFAFISQAGWDDDATHAAPGGVWWSQQMPNPRFIHRNTIATAPSAELALHLYELTGGTDASYVDWGRRMFDWVETYLRTPDGLYGDHVDLAGIVDQGALTYNQGVMIGAAALLHRVTGEDRYLQRAVEIAHTAMATYDPLTLNQGYAYNAIYYRRLLLLQSATGDLTYRQAAQTYADRLWETARDPETGVLRPQSGRPGNPNPPKLLDQTALAQLHAALAWSPSQLATLT